MKKSFLVTGGIGFIGSNICHTLLKQGHDVTSIDNMSRIGSEKNLLWLNQQSGFKHLFCDIRNRNDVNQLFQSSRFDAVFHLAGQVAMTTSIANPYCDFETNVCGTMNILEALRQYQKETCIVYASTNKVYGELEHMEVVEKETRYEPADANLLEVKETAGIGFQTPYGCSKGAAEQYVLDYHKTFGLKTVVFRHSTVYGGRQFANFDQGWVGWFCRQSILTKHNNSHTFTVNGNGKQVRDLLYVDDVVNSYYSAFEQIDRCQGQVFNIGGGHKNSLSIVELLEYCSDKLNVKMNIEHLPNRVSDQMYYVSCVDKAKQLLKWEPLVSVYTGVDQMLTWEENCLHLS